MEKKYKSGWKSAWAIYPKRNLRKNIWRPIVFAAIAACCYCCSSKSACELIGLVSGWITSGFPSIIGFVLSGYVLIVGFSGSDFLLSLAKPRNDNYTLFQVLNSTFAVVIATMIVTYAIGALYGFIISCDFVWPINIKWLCVVYNFIAFLLIDFIFFYAVFSLVDIVVNIFNMGQMANVIAEKKIETIQSEKEFGSNRDVSFFRTLINAILGRKPIINTHAKHQPD